MLSVHNVCTVCVHVCRVQAGQNTPVSGPLEFNAQFESGNLRKAIQVCLITHLQVRQADIDIYEVNMAISANGSQYPFYHGITCYVIQ